MKKYLFLLIVFVQFATFPQIKWESVSSPLGGKITYLNVNSSGEYLAGIQGDYIYVSSDNGNEWEPTSLTSSYFYQIKSDNDGNIFAITELPTASPEAGVFIYGPAFRPLKLRNWKLINKGIGSVVARQIAIAPSGYLYLATTGGVYKSADKGNNWSLSGLSGKFVRSIETDKNGNIFAGVDYEGIYKSTDNGNSWIKAGNIPINHYFEIYIDQAGTIFTVLYYPLEIYPMGIYRSTDGGDTWEEKNNGIIDPNISSIISIKPGTLVCTGPKGIFYRTTNNGDNWEMTTHLPTASPITSICRLPDNSILASSNGVGLIKSIDEGKSFQILKNNIKKLSINSLVAFNNNEMIAISIDDVYRTTDNGLNWTASGMDLPYADKTLLFRTWSGDLYVNAYYSGVYKSSDNGYSWEYVKIDSMDALGFPIIQSKNGDIFAKSVKRDGMVKSTDGGNTWSYINVPVYDDLSTLTSGSQNEIYATSFGRLFKSNDGGINWILKEHAPVFATAMKAYSNHIFIASMGSLYISTDEGETWTVKYITDNIINDITFTKEGNILLAIQGDGIKMSTNFGQTWTIENNGLTNLNVNSFFNDGNNKIYIGTSDGIFSTNFSTTSINSLTEHPTKYNLEHNYPNPFNPSTKISYNLAYESKVRISIYNLLGQEIMELVNNVESEGTHILNFNAANLASGIYFYKISAISTNGNKSFTDTKKLILMK